MSELTQSFAGPGGRPDKSVDDPGDLPQLLQQAERLELAGKPLEAEPLYRRLVRALPENPSLLHNLALLLLQRGELDEADFLLRRAVALSPKDAVLQNSFGTLLQRRGRLDDAGIAYRKALELKSDYADPHFNLAAVLEEQGHLTEALHQYRAALSRRPHDARALTRIGAILDKQGAPEEALAELDRAVEKGSHFFDAHYYRGSVLASLGRHDEALLAFNSAASLRPASFEALLATANSLAAAGRNDEALAAWWRVLELRPAAAATHEALNVLAWSAGRSDLYLRSFDYARQHVGLDPELLLMEAAFRFRNRQLEHAEKLLWQAYSRAPQRGDVLGLMARVITRQGRFEEAYALFSRAIEAEPGAVAHRQEFGFALLSDGQAGEALTVFEQALVLAPFDQIALSGLAMAYRELGDSRYQALMNPAYVRTYDIKAPRGHIDAVAFNQALERELVSLHTTKVEPITQTLRGGTQTAGQLFAAPRPLVQQIRESLQEAIADYIRDLPQDLSHPTARRATANFDFSGSWSCQLGSQGFHANHVHPEGWISSAYYAGLPSELNDKARRSGWLKFGESNLGLGEQDRPDSYVQPVVGRLVLFPSFFWHGTVPFDDAGKRVTIAFDVVPRPRPGAGLPE
jgi:tetratricopeptide (TPR) repeat protein